jgi:hypothetical protein
MCVSSALALFEACKFGKRELSVERVDLVGLDGVLAIASACKATGTVPSSLSAFSGHHVLLVGSVLARRKSLQPEPSVPRTLKDGLAGCATDLLGVAFISRLLTYSWAVRRELLTTNGVSAGAAVGARRPGRHEPAH